MNLTATHKSLIEESKLPNNFEICDNIDLDSIYLEYSSYYHLKFGKYPKFIRKIESGEKNDTKIKIHKTIKKQTSASSLEKKSDQIPQPIPLEDSLQISHLNANGSVTRAEMMESPNYLKNNCKMLTLNLDNYPNELQDLVKFIKADIITKDLKTSWNDIFGAEKAKTVLQEGLILPYEHPELFEGITTPWRSLLIYGPPGNGKTLIAKALSTETFGKLTFFNISPSSITSKWRGESEKLIRVNNL